MTEQAVVVDGDSLDCATVAAVAAGTGSTVRLDPDAAERAEHSWRLAEELATHRVVYGRTTGVGANREAMVQSDSAAEHGKRLLRSHAGGSGHRLPDEQVRAMLLIRLNQLAAGHSGAHPRLLRSMADALRQDALPVVHEIGAIGTSDLTALAETGLALAGEGPWSRGTLPAIEIGSGDALAFMSSNAATLAQAALACVELDTLLRASHAVAALSYIALDGSPEAYATSVHQARAHPGQVYCAEELRRLLGMRETPRPGRRVQDPFGLRAFPQVQGPALDAVRYLSEVLHIEMNTGPENPMVSVADGEIYHHAHFHTAYLSSALDHTRGTLHQVAELSAARLGDLVEPAFTDLPAFLASGPSGSSGVMILEYVAHDALTQLRHAALPVTLGTAVVSRGLEDHASFSTQAARQAREAATAYRVVLSCELVAAVRALRMRAADLVDLPVREAYDAAASILDPSMADRPLTADLARAQDLLDSLAGW
ncbi:histidine ammonia-lyase [Tamaricihabitans halophyticus]|uniref:Histidine ammonia-lyase n=1 Tax=Tamaricihabitans halophyticus TaxID=1262583 RepID=A0A4R2QLM1_9PSEU|nr:aromatic amino acid ammonia-lyase [Tamaricihabitans halophyticus]TCP47931.1 histidine ammonia-lyase [Tamaricihabitans halophyticus]